MIAGLIRGRSRACLRRARTGRRIRPVRRGLRQGLGRGEVGEAPARRGDVGRPARNGLLLRLATLEFVDALPRLPRRFQLRRIRRLVRAGSGQLLAALLHGPSADRAPVGAANTPPLSQGVVMAIEQPEQPRPLGSLHGQGQERDRFLGHAGTLPGSGANGERRTGLIRNATAADTAEGRDGAGPKRGLYTIASLLGMREGEQRSRPTTSSSWPAGCAHDGDERCRRP